MARKLMGKKQGMTQVFDDLGNAIACTIIHAEPNVVTQIKTVESDGYNAIQVGYEEIIAKDPRKKKARTKKPLRGHFAKGGVEPRRHLTEFRVDDVEEYSLGQEIGVNEFNEGDFIDVIGTSKGKGYQGVMKLYNFKGGPGAHGSGFHRHAGSTGMRSTPGHCLAGGKRPCHMGQDRVTVQNVAVVHVDAEENIIIVKGQVPGPCGGLVFLSAAKKAGKK